MITAEQRADRRLHIGGSDAPVIAGEVGSRLALWLEKTGRLAEKPQNEAMEAGTWLERGVVDWIEHKLGKEVLRGFPTIVHSDNVRAANLDGLVPDERAIIEAKTSGILSGRVYEADLWGEPGTDTVPPRVAIQCQHNMDVASDYYGVAYDVAIVPALLVGIGLVRFRVPRSNRLSQALADLEGEFWEGHVLKDIPPSETDADLETLKRVIRGAAKRVPLADEMVDAWRHAREQRLGWEKEEKHHLELVLSALGDAEVGVVTAGEFTYFEQRQQMPAQEARTNVFRVPRWKGTK